MSNRLASSTGPILRLRARRHGLDWLTAKAPELELYYEPGDPHSTLCAQLLPALQARLKTQIRIHVVGEPQAVLYPEANKQRQFALDDALRMAPAWGLQFPAHAQLPDTQARHTATAQLLEYSGGSQIAGFVRREQEVMAALWSGELAHSGQQLQDDRRLLQANRRRRKRGHYLPGMWQFNGEWFWGLDRLAHLEQRLRALHLLDGEEPIAHFDATKARLPVLDGPQPLEFFFSFRSPYSYLAAVQVQQLRAQLGVPLTIRPVLPMVMRGLKVPSAKRLYIVRDVYREARRLDIPFGHIADPVGAGAQRCLSAYTLADGVDQQAAFIAGAARAIWSEAVAVANDAGLRHVCEQAGMDWGQVSELLAGGPQLDYAEHNRQAMFAAGLWGVPTFKLGDFATWGRDRLWMVTEVLRRSGLLESH